MNLKVQIISKETIKPSSPTPEHLRTLKLSHLDQCMFLCYLPAVIFYEASEGDSEGHTQIKLERLKKSLSQILTYFYPLAGRVKDNHVIGCNDEGVNFFEARVNGRLNQVLTNPIPEVMDALLPEDDFFEVRVLLSIQVNIFQCGGIAVGVIIGHKIADASSFSLFLNSWSAMARGEEESISVPKFDMTSFFPPKDIPFTFFPIEEPKGKRVVSKRFVFEGSNMSALKARASSSSYIQNPTRLEAIYSLLWRSAMNVIKMREKPAPSSSVLVFPVNLRPRMNPPLSNLYVGNNMIRAAISSSTHEQPPELVGQWRKTTRGIDSDHVSKLVHEDGISQHNAYLDEVFLQHSKGELELYFFTSWCRFPFYETDFGWGKPTWVAFVNTSVPNNFVLMDTKCGDGVEALVTLVEEDMERFVAQPDILRFTTSTNGDPN